MGRRGLTLVLAVGVALSGALPAVGADDAADSTSATGTTGTTDSTDSTGTTGTTGTVEGTVARVAVGATSGGSHVVTLIVTDSGDAVRVRSDALADAANGARVRATLDGAGDQSVVDPDAGATVLDLDVVDEAADAGIARVGTPTSIRGTRSVVALVGWLPAQGGTTLTTAPISTAITEVAHPWWNGSTDTISFVVTEQALAGSFDAWGDAATCTGDQVWGLLEWAGARLGGVSRVGTGSHAVLLTDEYAACTFRSISQLGNGGTVWLNGSRDSTGAELTHQLGYTLGLGASNSRVGCQIGGLDRADGTTDDCWDGYRGDPYDLMGFQTGLLALLSGAQLDALGLLTDANSVVARGTTTTATLQSVEGQEGVRFLKIEAGDVTYHVEFRASVYHGCPGGLVDEASALTPCGGSAERVDPGVVIRRVEDAGSYTESFLLDAPVQDPHFDPTLHGLFVLPQGMTFTAASGLLTIKVTAVTTDAATVSVTAAAPPVEQIVMTRDMTGDGKADGFVVDGAGALHLLPGLGNGRLGALRPIGPGWGAMRVFAPGDWNSDGKADLVAADGAGYLWLYPGRNTGTLSAKVRIGNGWNGFRIVPAGDMNNDGRADLLAIDTAGRLWLYPGAGLGKFGQRRQVGNGWTGFDLYAAGDANRDGRMDILSIDSAGKLWYYAGRGGGYFTTRQQVGRGWTGFEFASGADLNRDGLSDLLGRDPAGSLYFYPGRLGGGFGSRVRVASGW